MKPVLAETFPRIFLERCQKTPNRLMFQSQAGKSLLNRVLWKTPAEKKSNSTYGEFFNKTELLFLGLFENKIHPGNRIAIQVQDLDSLLMLQLAIQAAGGIPVPIYNTLSSDDIAYCLENSGVVGIFVEGASNIEKLKKISLPSTTWICHLQPITEALELKSHSFSIADLYHTGEQRRARSMGLFQNKLGMIQKNEIHSISYTAGTGGKPKGVVLTQDNILSSLEDGLKELSSKKNEIIGSVLLPAHAMTRFGITLGVAMGWSILSKAEDISEATLVFTSPSLLERAYREHLNPCPKARAYFISGSGVEPKVSNYVRKLGRTWNSSPQIFEGYGMTETAGPITAFRKSKSEPTDMGLPLNEVCIRISDQGEIQVKSRKICRGYVLPSTQDSPLKVDSSILTPDGWYQTGDLGFIDEDGHLHLTGRRKEVFVTSLGRSLSPYKIEASAKVLPYIDQFVVCGDGKSYLSALVALDENKILKYAEENSILFSEFSELVKHPKIRGLIRNLLDELNISLAPEEWVKKFVILSKKLPPELYSSDSVKRSEIESLYQNDIQELYR